MRQYTLVNVWVFINYRLHTHLYKFSGATFYNFDEFKRNLHVCFKGGVCRNWLQSVCTWHNIESIHKVFLGRHEGLFIFNVFTHRQYTNAFSFFGLYIFIYSFQQIKWQWKYATQMNVAVMKYCICISSLVSYAPYERAFATYIYGEMYGV